MAPLCMREKGWEKGNGLRALIPLLALEKIEVNWKGKKKTETGRTPDHRKIGTRMVVVKPVQRCHPSLHESSSRLLYQKSSRGQALWHY
jgi:hypothetical protein